MASDARINELLDIAGGAKKLWIVPPGSTIPLQATISTIEDTTQKTITDVYAAIDRYENIASATFHTIDADQEKNLLKRLDSEFHMLPRRQSRVIIYVAAGTADVDSISDADCISVGIFL